MKKWCNDQNGYGFIQPDYGCKDLFVAISAIDHAGLPNLSENPTISYEATADRKNRKLFAKQLRTIRLK